MTQYIFCGTVFTQSYAYSLTNSLMSLWL